MNARALLILSLVLNAGLLGGVGYLLTRAPAGTGAETAAGVAKEEKAATAKSAPGADKKGGVRMATNTVVQTIDWRAVESEDYKKYIANLRAIGCPEETIRDIIIADVNKLFESRRQALGTAKKKFEYWKAGQSVMPTVDDETLKQRQQLANEKRALLRELLGVDVATDKAETTAAALGPLLAMMDFLSPAKQDAVVDLLLKTQNQALKMLKGGAPDPDDVRAIQKLKNDMHAELAKMLTPEEYKDYQLRLSDVAVIMRMQLGTFDPSEQEFVGIFNLRKEFDDQYPMMLKDILDKDERAKRDTAEKEMDGKIKDLLGDTRSTEYTRSIDQAYAPMVKLAEKQNLPRDVANKFYDMKKVAEDQAKQVRADKSLSDEQRAAALRTIRTEVETQGQAIFGEQGFGNYQRTAYWIKGISPDAK